MAPTDAIGAFAVAADAPCARGPVDKWTSAPISPPECERVSRAVAVCGDALEHDVHGAVVVQAIVERDEPRQRVEDMRNDVAYMQAHLDLMGKEQPNNISKNGREWGDPKQTDETKVQGGQQ